MKKNYQLDQLKNHYPDYQSHHHHQSTSPSPSPSPLSSIFPYNQVISSGIGHYNHHQSSPSIQPFNPLIHNHHHSNSFHLSNPPDRTTINRFSTDNPLQNINLNAQPIRLNHQSSLPMIPNSSATQNLYQSSSQLCSSLAAFTDSLPQELIPTSSSPIKPSLSDQIQARTVKSKQSSSSPQQILPRPQQTVNQHIPNQQQSSAFQSPGQHQLNLSHHQATHNQVSCRSTSQPNGPSISPAQFYLSKARRVSSGSAGKSETSFALPCRRKPLINLQSIQPKPLLPLQEPPTPSPLCHPQPRVQQIPHREVPDLQQPLQTSAPKANNSPPAEVTPNVEQFFLENTPPLNVNSTQLPIKERVLIQTSSEIINNEKIPSEKNSSSKLSQTCIIGLQPLASSELPPTITLLHLARVHLREARELGPRLLERPRWNMCDLVSCGLKRADLRSDLKAEAFEREMAACAYRKHIRVAISCLRSILGLSRTASDSVPAELNLITRCLLVETLLRETKESREISESIQQGLSIARQRDSFAPLKFMLLELQVLTDVRDGKVPFRQIKKQLERCIEMTLKNGSVDPKHVVWYYRFQLLLSHIAYERVKDFPIALSAIRNVLDVARSRNDKELWIAVKTREIRLAMDRSQWILSGDLFKSILAIVELPTEPEANEGSLTWVKEELQLEKRVAIGQQLKVYIMLLLTLYYSITGVSKSAKWWLKNLQEAMDESEQMEIKIEGVYKVYLQSSDCLTRQRRLSMITPVKSGFCSAPIVDSPFTKLFEEVDLQGARAPSELTNSTSTQYISISTMPLDFIRTFIYILGIAVYFDGHGKSPKALQYALEGVERIDRQLTLGLQLLNKEQKNVSTDFRLDEIMSLEFMQLSLDRLLDIKIEAILMMSQLAIIRSDFQGADQLLVNAIRLARGRGRWKSLSARISLIKGMLSHATVNMVPARKSLLAAIFISSSPKMVDCGQISLASDVSILAKASYVLARLSDEHYLDCDTELEAGRLLQLDRLTKELAAAVKDSLPNLDMSIQLVLALRCGEIVRAKQHLTVALNDANKTSNTHLKTILLGLLSSMFLNTRNDQAFKMLHSCFKLAIGFNSGKFKSQAGLFNLVGHANLGLWAGRKLLEIYKHQSDEIKVKKQRALNEAHEKVVLQIPTL